MLRFKILQNSKRILYGVAKAITEHINLGNSYKEVKKIYSISILYFDLGKGSDYLYVGQNNFIGVHTKDQLQVNAKEKGTIVKKSPSDIFPEYILVRVNEFNKVAVTPLEEWIDYLKNGEIRPDTQAPGLQEARKKLQYYSMNDADRLAYDKHIDSVMIQNDVLESARDEGLAQGMAQGIEKGMAQGIEKGMAQGIEKGMAQGALREKLFLAKKLLDKGLSLQEVSELTNLPVDELQEASLN